MTLIDDDSDATVASVATAPPMRAVADRPTPRRQRFARFAKAEPSGVIGLVAIVIIVGAALLAPWIAPYDPLQQFREDILAPPSAEFWLGTDTLGRDVLSRIIFGARTSMIIAVSTSVIACLIGVAVGVTSGLVGGVADLIVQRITDAIESVPPIVLLLLIAAILGPSIPNSILALSIVLIPSFNRIARGEVLRLKQEPYIEASRTIGAGPVRIVFRHLLPNMMGAIMTLVTLRFAGVIVAESALSFLGLGAPPPTPSWGSMLSSAVKYIEIAPWLIVFPAIALSAAVLAFNMLGDALRDFLDPRLVRTRA